MEKACGCWEVSQVIITGANRMIRDMDQPLCVHKGDGSSSCKYFWQTTPTEGSGRKLKAEDASEFIVSPIFRVFKGMSCLGSTNMLTSSMEKIDTNFISTLSEVIKECKCNTCPKWMLDYMYRIHSKVEGFSKNVFVTRTLIKCSLFKL